MGIVSGGAHIVGDLMLQMMANYLEGNVKKASELYFTTMPLFKARCQSGEVNPIPLLKDAIRLHAGINVGRPPRPSLGATAEEEAVLRKVLKSLGRLPA